MTKLPLLIAAGLLSLRLGAATPSFASSIASCQDDATADNHGDNTFEQSIAMQSDAIMAGLRQKGINATDITDWGGCVKADVVQKNGHTAMEFFDPSTLQRLSVNG